MAADSGLVALEQLFHLVDVELYRFALKLHFKFCLPILRLEENNQSFVIYLLLFLHQHFCPFWYILSVLFEDLAIHGAIKQLR